MAVFRSLNSGEETLAAALERDCLSTAWSEKQIAETTDNPNAIYVAAFEGSVLCGIASAYCVCGDGEIMNLAVSPSFRRRGIALGLMKALHDALIQKGCNTVSLEVAEDNLSAISLYQKCGYRAVGKRKGFYKGTDAVLMLKEIV